MFFRLPGLRRRLAKFLARHADPRFLLTSTLVGDGARKRADGH
jgi:hypothetical protein